VTCFDVKFFFCFHVLSVRLSLISLLFVMNDEVLLAADAGKNNQARKTTGCFDRHWLLVVFKKTPEIDEVKDFILMFCCKCLLYQDLLFCWGTCENTKAICLRCIAMASSVKKVVGAGSFNFLTSTENVRKTAANFRLWVIKISIFPLNFPKMRVFSFKFCIFEQRFHSKKIF